MRKIRIPVVILATCVPALSLGCATTYNPLGARSSWTDTISASVKSGSSRVAAVFTPKKSTPDDPSPAPSGKPGAGMFTAMAQLQERNGNLDEAAVQYQKALDVDPNHLGALQGYARLQDRRNHLEEATKLYQRAAKKHSKDPSVHNDLGLCFHRRGMLDDAVKSLKRAVELRSDSKLYRNNLASVYVEQGKVKEALAQLNAVHAEAVAHYNLAYLLEQKQDHAAALTHFRKAAEKDPSLVAAQQWIAKLETPPGAAAPNTASVASRPPRITRPATDSYAAAIAPVTPPAAFVPASGIYPAEPASPRVASRGIQFPQVRPGETAGDAVPPTPSGAVTGVNRLPSVSR